MAKEGLHQALNRLLRENVALSQQVAERDAEIADLKARNHKLWCEECNASHALALWEEHTKLLLKAASTVVTSVNATFAIYDNPLNEQPSGAIVDFSALVALNETVKAIEARHPELKGKGDG